MESNSNSKAFKIILLVAVVVIAGIYLLSQMDLSTSQAPDNNPPQNSTDSSGLTAEEKAVLNAPKAGDSQEVIDAHGEAVRNAAVKVDSVTLGAACRTSPVAVEMAKGKSLSFKNADSVAHSVFFDATHFVAVPAGGSASITLNFVENSRVYGYGCELSSNPIGMVLIAE
jgi:hypothetical protein